MRTWKYNVFLILTLIVGSGFGCASDADGTGPEQQNRTIVPLVVNFDQTTVVPTSVLAFELGSTERVVAERAEVQFVGRDGTGREIDVVAFVDGTDRIGDQGNIVVNVPVDAQLWATIDPRPNAFFEGSIEVRLLDEIGVFAEGTRSSELEFKSEVVPGIDQIPNGIYFVNQDVSVTGENFLRDSEGATYAVVNGTITYEDETPPREIANERVRMPFDGARGNGIFPIDPSVFGIAPATFSGDVSFVNELRNGQTFMGNRQSDVQFKIEQTFLSNIDPAAGSRGQRINFRGRGFVPNEEGEDFYGMLFRFEGELTFDSGGTLDLTGENAIERSPDAVTSDDVALLSVWYDIEDGELTGLGAEPGVFDGEITPIVFDRFSEAEGVSVPVSFRILPTRQVVHLKYLPAFYKGLEDYGLQNVERDIRQRILEVVRRDYQGINVTFQEDVPTEFIDFATIEIGGPDPSGGDKFGYDNTCNPETETCKDTDNLFLADYLGGVNANSAEEFNTPYGGIFIESFDYFSPTLNPGVPDTSPEFDRIIGAFMPELGGDPVRGTEWPGGARDEQIAEAIKLVGSVIGNTISHEIGHSLGLAFYPADRIRPGEAFHNRIPGDNYIMDPGGARPFEERAELGLGPAAFNERNREYLLEILPIRE